MRASSAAGGRIAALAAAVSIVGCGASYQSIYEGDVRFEHCYRLDEDARVPLAHKFGCWNDLSRYYTYGQTRDRVEYALARKRAIDAAAHPSAAPPPAPTATGAIACPMPTSAFAPPPQTLPAELQTPVPSGPSAFVDPGGAPGSSCGASCGRTWAQCGAGCIAATCKAECDEKYRGCMRSCF